MGSRRVSAEGLVKPACQGLVERTQAATERVVFDPNDPEAVHDFRVGMRRLRTVLRAARALYGKKKIGALEQALKRFGDATNALRDEEVLTETLELVGLSAAARRAVEAWLKRRTAYERKLRRSAIELLRGESVNDAFAALLALLERGPKRKLSAAQFAKQQLAAARQGVNKLLPASEDNVEGLHRLRIRFKRLRYTSEMLGQFMTRADASEALRRRNRLRRHKPSTPNYAAIARLAARMQKDLGILHDVDVAIETVRRARSLPEPQQNSTISSLLRLRKRLATKAVERLDELPPQLLG